MQYLLGIYLWYPNEFVKAFALNELKYKLKNKEKHSSDLNYVGNGLKDNSIAQGTHLPDMLDALVHTFSV